jgi:hypothetical protein
MEKTGKVLSKKKKQRLIDLYASQKPKKEVQEILSEEFGCSERHIRQYAKEFGLNVLKSNIISDKVMVYDIETSRVKIDAW